MKGKSIYNTLALVLAGIVFGAIIVSSSGLDRPSFADVKLGTDEAPVQKVDLNSQAFNYAFTETAAKVTPSIVQISVISRTKRGNASSDLLEKFFGDKRPQRQRPTMGGGSGVIISEDGFIITNNHVVEEATDVKVIMTDRREYEASVIGTDPLTDLAVIKTDETDLPAVHFGDSDKLKVGEWVMAIGNPMSLTSTVTAGIVSAIGRNLNIIRDSYSIESFIQTDAAINPKK